MSFLRKKINESEVLIQKHPMPAGINENVMCKGITIKVEPGGSGVPETKLLTLTFCTEEVNSAMYVHKYTETEARLQDPKYPFVGENFMNALMHIVLITNGNAALTKYCKEVNAAMEADTLTVDMLVDIFNANINIDTKCKLKLRNESFNGGEYVKINMALATTSGFMEPMTSSLLTYNPKKDDKVSIEKPANNKGAKGNKGMSTEDLLGSLPVVTSNTSEPQGNLDDAPF